MSPTEEKTNVQGNHCWDDLDVTISSFYHFDHGFEENECQVSEQMGSLGREIEIIKKDQMEILGPQSMAA